MESFFFEWTLVVVLLILILGVVASVVLWTFINGISPMPTSPSAKACLLSLLPDELHGNIYELGSGWGTLLFPLAKKYPLCRAIGLETSPLPFYSSLAWLKVLKLSNVELIRKDFFTANLSDASLVVCYLYPKAMEKLKLKFLTELKPGTLVVTNTFAVSGWKPEAVVDCCDLYHTKIYLYKIR